MEDTGDAERHGHEGSHRHEEQRGHGGWHRHEEKQGRHGHAGEHEHRSRRNEHGRGRDLSPDMRRVPDGDDLYALLRACEHHLHHNFQGHRSRAEENALFNVLDESEKEKLQELLKKLVDSWE